MSIYDKASLVLIPSGTKTSKVYSQKPVSGDGDFTFSRSTAATRVNADGNIEKETQNLLLQSNNFGNGGYWNDVAVSVTGGQAGYDGTNDAFLITKQSSSFARLQQNLSLSGVVTMSAYLKAGTESLSTFRLGISDYAVQFRLDNQTILDTGNIAAIDTGIEDVGSGWYRCHATWNVVSTSVVQYYVGWNVSDSKTLYIQDAQVERGLVARDYIETTTTAVEGGITDNVPRLDYTDSSCPALLLEPQRTNVYPYSEYSGSGALTGFSTGTSTQTITNNYTESPEGFDNAIRFQATCGSTIDDRSGLRDLVSVSQSDATLSFYMKSNTGSNQTLTFHYAGGHRGTITATPEWQRFDYTESSPVTSNYCGFEIRGTITDTDVDVSVYGFQMEQGNYATSYIPTYGSAVTRNADSGNVLQLLSNGLIGSNQWTFFAELEVSNNTPSSDKMALTDANEQPRTYLYNTTAGWAGGWSGSSYALPLGSNAKVAWRLNDSRNGNIFANGALRATISNQSVDMTADRILLRGQQGTWRLKQILLFPTALTDQEAIDLTTL